MNGDEIPFKVYSKTFADYGLCDICQCVNLPVTTFRKQIYCVDCYVTERRAQGKRRCVINSNHINAGQRRRYHSKTSEQKDAYLINQRKRREEWRKKNRDDPVAYANTLEYNRAYRKKMTKEQKLKWNKQKRNSSRKIKLQRNNQTLLNLKHKLDNDEQN